MSKQSPVIGDLLESYNDQEFEYDAIGNPTKYRDGMSMLWSNGRQLTNLTKDDKTTITYTYDDSGMRLSKTVDGVEYTYLYEGGLLVQETRGNKVFDYSYDANGRIRMVVYRATASATPETYYYALNSRNDVIGIYTHTGKVFAKYEYDVWGNLLSITNQTGGNLAHFENIATLQPFRYRSYYYDTESGFYYLQSRYYDPVNHRFINADGYVSTGTGILGHNMFTYCNNNPIMYSDGNGEKLYFAGFVGPIQQGDYRIGESYARTINSKSNSKSSKTNYQNTVYITSAYHNTANNKNLSHEEYKRYSELGLGLTCTRSLTYSMAGVYVSDIGTSAFLGGWGSLFTVPVSNMGHRYNPYLLDNQKNVLCGMEWGFAIASVAVPIFISNCWNPMGWTAGTIALIGIGISFAGVATISCTENYYVNKNQINGTISWE